MFRLATSNASSRDEVCHFAYGLAGGYEMDVEFHKRRFIALRKRADFTADNLGFRTNQGPGVIQWRIILS